MNKAIFWYDVNSATVIAQYESLHPEKLHGWLTELLPDSGGLALDVGAGSGRDAAWLAARGMEVIALEPSQPMREEARRLHPIEKIQWIDDSLPDLRAASRTGITFDFILLSAVWMHVPPSERTRAFRKLITLLKPGGLLAISLRCGPADEVRSIHPVSEQEIEQLAKTHGAFIERRFESSDEQGRSGITWIQLAIRLPDDGSGALPLLRHVILNDDKSSTYKLALLRTLCRIADGASGYTQLGEDDLVSVPLGLVGLYWLRLFKPLLTADLPQSPTNRGLDRLGFVKADFRDLISTAAGVSQHDLRVGMTFSGALAKTLHFSIRDACKTIEEMPANYMRYPGGGPILPVSRQSRGVITEKLTIDEAYLNSFGQMRVPHHLWSALRRFEVWIEPALIAEWSRLIKGYAQAQGRTLSEGTIVNAMNWSEPERDVRVARDQALRLIESPGLRCVWTDRVLNASNLDIDHCLPWVAWPCGDLWNLMPAHQSINRQQKRDRLPSDSVLRAAQTRIQQWWEQAYFKSGNPVLPERFTLEARASLPMTRLASFEYEEVFTGLSIQRLRLKHDQQVPEWAG